MTATDITPTGATRKRPIFRLLMWVLLFFGGAAAGFFASSSGMIFATDSSAQKIGSADSDDRAEIAFVSLDPLTISLGGASNADHLRFRAELEVASVHKEEVSQMLPRIVDVLNSYLRALEPSDLQAPAALTRLRGQMLRRIQIVVGEGRVNDLLVMEFVLN